MGVMGDKRRVLWCCDVVMLWCCDVVMASPHFGAQLSYPRLLRGNASYIGQPSPFVIWFRPFPCFPYTNIGASPHCERSSHPLADKQTSNSRTLKLTHTCTHKHTQKHMNNCTHTHTHDTLAYIQHTRMHAATPWSTHSHPGWWCIHASPRNWHAMAGWPSACSSRTTHSNCCWGVWAARRAQKYKDAQNNKYLRGCRLLRIGFS